MSSLNVFTTFTTQHWKPPMDIFGGYFGEKDFFCLECNGIFSVDACQCSAGEEEIRRLMIPGNKAHWCHHYMMNIIPGQCQDCIKHRRNFPLNLECDSSDEDDVWTRYRIEIQDEYTW